MENQSKLILVIEDDVALLELIVSKLHLKGYQTAVGRSVEQATAYMADNEKIDAIWLDHFLLGSESGLDLLARIKNSEKWKNIPIFLVSNVASSDQIEMYKKYGIKKYFSKVDYNLDEIVVDIDSTLKS